MKAIVPAAGLGSRLRPHTFMTPKALIPVAGKPILYYIIQQLMDWGIDKFSIVHGYLGGKIEEYVNEAFKIDVQYRIQDKPKGIGHAVSLAIEDDDEDVLVVLGDTIIDADIIPHISKGVSAVGVKKVSDARKFGVVLSENGKVSKFLEKPKNPPSSLALVGIYYFRSAKLLKKAINETIRQGLTVKGEYQITDALQLLLDWGEPINTMRIDGWCDCGNPETLIETNKYLLDRDGGIINAIEKEHSILIPPVFIGESTVVSKSIIGPYASIGKNSYIEDTIIRNSIIGDKATVSQALLSEAIVGNRTEIKGRMHQINLGTSCWLKI